MRLPYIARNARSGDLLELFFVSAITSLLLVRAFLFVTGYPQVGGDSLHIAHMLWGGLLMLAALLLFINGLGNRAQRLASVVGGTGFGLFIDELGKFITRDNNYFFQPTIAIIYLIFILLFLGSRAVRQRRELSPNESLLNAIMMLEEAAHHDLDEVERRRLVEYLDRADPAHPLTGELQALIGRLGVIPAAEPGWVTRLRATAEVWYRRFVTSRWGSRLIVWAFIANAVVGLVSIFLVILATLVDIPGAIVNYRTVTPFSILQLCVSAVTAAMVLAGATIIRRSRLAAYHLFTRATLINLFVTQFFDFYHQSLGALPMFLGYLALYIALRFLTTEERRMQTRDASAPPTRQRQAA